MRGTHWLVMLAMASATTAWPWKPTSSLQNSGDNNGAEKFYEHGQLYIRDTASVSSTTTSADTTTTAAAATTDPTTTTTATTASAASTSSTTTTTSSSSTTSTTASTTTATSTTSAATTTTSSSVSTATTSSTSTASTTTTSTSSTSTSNASASASASAAAAAAELAEWNHTGEIRAIVVFSILGGLIVGFTLYSLIKRLIRNRKAKANRFSMNAGSSYSSIPLTAAADSKDSTRLLQQR